jgi:nucleoside-specific outer membrane channel protein Tsx
MLSSKNFVSTLLSVGILASPAVMAEQLWSDASLTYLNGSDFKVGDSKRQYLTFEHASGHTWGDNFFFIDHSESDKGAKNNYFELAPRVSLSYLTGKELKTGLIKDVYLAGTLEGSANADNYLAGVGVGLNVPKFKYVNVNVYKANNEKIADDEQLTVTWALPLQVGKAEFLYDGFIDTSTKQDDHAAETNFTSQIKWDAGKQLFHTKKPIYVGIEQSEWRNKFGIDGVNESNPAFMIKAHF